MYGCSMDYVCNNCNEIHHKQLASVNQSAILKRPAVRFNELSQMTSLTILNFETCLAVWLPSFVLDRVIRKGEEVILLKGLI
jgi:hypothetical protein